MFSSRTPSSYSPNRLTQASAARRAAGLPVHDLTLSNPTQAGIDCPEHLLLAALGDARSLRYEPTPKGLAEARRAISAHHAARGVKVDAESLVLVSSTSEAYGWLFKLLCEPGAAVLVPRPSYPLFECLAGLESVEARQYPLVEADQWHIDFDALAAAAPGARAVIVVNPNNPTGSYVRREDFARLLEFSAKRGLAVIADEVFWDYQWRAVERVTGFARQREALCFALSGMSKSIGLPQMKLGWISVEGPEALRRDALERLEWIADAYLPVSAPVQYAAAAWLEAGETIQASIRRRCEESLDAICRALPEECSVRLREPEGGWSAILEVPRTATDEEWALKMLDHGFLFQPGYYYDFAGEGRLVVSLLAAPGTIAAGVRELLRLAEEAGASDREER